MTSYIGEPFLLSSHPHTTHASLATSPSSRDGYVSLTSQADGVHVSDLSTLHPVISHTLGPATYFSCPAVSRFDRDLCTTYVVVESAPEVGRDEAGRTVWFWRESVQGVGAKKEKMVSPLLPSRVSKIYLPSSPHLLLVSPNGDLTSTDLDVKILHRRPSKQTILLASFFFLKCAFVPQESQVLVLVTGGEKEKDTQVEVVAVGMEEGAFERLGLFNVHVDPQTISSVSCSASGTLTVLTHTGLWNSYHLSSPPSLPLTLTEPSSTPVHLSPTALNLPTAKTLALTSSHVLLSARVPNSPKSVLLLIWDIAYGVLLASHTLAVPGEADVEMSLVGGTESSTVLLMMSPSARGSVAKGRKAMAFVVPCKVPPRSTIANAMGRSDASSAYLLSSTTTSSAPPTLTSPQRALLEKMRSADPTSASSFYFDDIASSEPLDEAFVKEILKIIWPDEKLLCPEVLRWVLERRLIRRRSGNVGEEGVVRALVRGGHLDLLPPALENIIDITEDDIIFALHTLLSLSHPTPHHHAMVVDAPTPSLPTLLASCVRAPASSNPLRVAMHRYLKEPVALCEVLGVLVGWVEEREVGILGVDDDERKEVPPLPKALTFLQALIDATTLTLLPHTPSHTLLHHLFSVLQPHIMALDQSERLRGPLELFARRAREEEKKKKEGKGNGGGGGDWRKRRREKKDAMEGMVGVYRIEELVL